MIEPLERSVETITTPIKILVVDDHPVFRRGLVSVLEEYAEVEVLGHAANGVDGVAMARELQPHVVVMDVRMAAGNGVEATAALKQIMPDVKVLMLTVSDKDEDLFAAVEAGARGYILKTAELEELIAAIKQVAAGDVIISPVMASRVIQQISQGSKVKENEDLTTLSPREREVLKLVSQGNSNREIAGSLFISETTVKAHLRSILEKLQVKNRAQAVAKATARGLLS
jgi:two-component system NarL family response regulator